MGQKKVKEIDLAEDKEKKEKAKNTEAEEKKSQPKEKTDKKEEKKDKGPAHSKRYRKISKKVIRTKQYSPQKAIELLINISNSNIDETVELHINTRKENLTGTINLPHGSGKKRKVAIADDKLLKKIEKTEEIDFDVLIATPQMMPKIAKLGPILGPRGLMPNPKNNTITEKPEELKKKMESGEIHFRTERKAPIIHLAIGKLSFKKKKLLENIKAAIEGIKKHNIKKATLTSTQSPGIKLNLEELEV